MIKNYKVKVKGGGGGFKKLTEETKRQFLFSFLAKISHPNLLILTSMSVNFV